VVKEKLLKTIEIMSEKEKKILLNALNCSGWVKLKVKSGHVVEGYTENKL